MLISTVSRGTFLNDLLIHFNFILDYQHSIFYTVKSSYEPRKGRHSTTSHVKAYKKAWKKIKEKHYGAWLHHQKNKREKKNDC